MQISFRKASEDSQFELEFIIDPFSSMPIWNCALKKIHFPYSNPYSSIKKNINPHNFKMNHWFSKYVMDPLLDIQMKNGQEFVLDKNLQNMHFLLFSFYLSEKN